MVLKTWGAFLLKTDSEASWHGPGEASAPSEASWHGTGEASAPSEASWHGTGEAIAPREASWHGPAKPPCTDARSLVARSGEAALHGRREASWHGPAKPPCTDERSLMARSGEAALHRRAKPHGTERRSRLAPTRDASWHKVAKPPCTDYAKPHRTDRRSQCTERSLIARTRRSHCTERSLMARNQRSHCTERSLVARTGEAIAPSEASWHGPANPLHRAKPPCTERSHCQAMIIACPNDRKAAWFYSQRRADSGLMRAARRAGTYPAASAARHNSMMPSRMASGSPGPT